MLKPLMAQGRLEKGDEELLALLGFMALPKNDPFRKGRVLVRIERAGTRPAHRSRPWPWSGLVSMLLAGSGAAAELTQRLFRRSPPR